MSKKTLHEIKPFESIEEIRERIQIPKSMWQRGCDDAKAGRPRAHGRDWSFDSYHKGYAYGVALSDEYSLPLTRMTEPGRYEFPNGTTVFISRQGKVSVVYSGD